MPRSSPSPLRPSYPGPGPNPGRTRQDGWTLAAVLGMLALVAAMTTGLLLLTGDVDDAGLAEGVAPPEGDTGRVGHAQPGRTQAANRAALVAQRADAEITAPEHESAPQGGFDVAGDSRPANGSVATEATEAELETARPISAGLAPTARTFTNSLADRPRNRPQPRDGEPSSAGNRGAPPLQYQSAVDQVRAERAAIEGVSPEDLATPPETSGRRTLSKKELAERSKTLLEMRREGLRITGQLPPEDDGDS